MHADTEDDERGAREEEEGEEHDDRVEQEEENDQQQQEEEEEETEQQERPAPKAGAPVRPRRQTLAGDGPWAVRHAASQLRRPSSAAARSASAPAPPRRRASVAAGHSLSLLTERVDAPVAAATSPAEAEAAGTAEARAPGAAPGAAPGPAAAAAETRPELSQPRRRKSSAEAVPVLGTAEGGATSGPLLELATEDAAEASSIASSSQ